MIEALFFLTIMEVEHEYLKDRFLYTAFGQRPGDVISCSTICRHQFYDSGKVNTCWYLKIISKCKHPSAASPTTATSHGDCVVESPLGRTVSMWHPCRQAKPRWTNDWELQANGDRIAWHPSAPLTHHHTWHPPIVQPEKTLKSKVLWGFVCIFKVFHLETSWDHWW